MGERSTKREREEEEERSPTTPATHRQGRPPQLPVLAHHHLRRPPAHPFEKIASPSRNHRRQTHLPPRTVESCLLVGAPTIGRQVLKKLIAKANAKVPFFTFSNLHCTCTCYSLKFLVPAGINRAA
ncbi:hypothetical protein RHMOL_Rhmol03G0171700 [Rhododendron molle]|uniref:Uncharacterized protein n=1 Tax=Rhododendron molle TaxID=49168 RepID=A0ACC0PIG8_RHOML|nr:hypothetical protein RHMOL_Rhmol03G0171700 [Rhododendron molle]